MNIKCFLLVLSKIATKSRFRATYRPLRHRLPAWLAARRAAETIRERNYQRFAAAHHAEATTIVSSRPPHRCRHRLGARPRADGAETLKAVRLRKRDNHHQPYRHRREDVVIK